MNQLIYLLKNSVQKFVIWLLIFLALYLYPSSFWQNTAFGLLAIVLGTVVSKVIWNFVPKDFITRLDDKAVLITGCDSGFGYNLAQKLDTKGVTVYAGCLFPEGDGATKLKDSCSSRLKILHLDVTRDDHVEDAVKTVKSTLGENELWALVNNAGVGAAAEVEWMTVENSKKTLEVNAIGPYRVSKAFLPLLRKSQGRIVIVASALGRVTLPGVSAYSMSKFAVAALADVLRREMIKWNVSVHTIEPWFYSSNMTNEEQITKGIQQNWFEAPKDVKDDYGKSYILEYQVSQSFFLNCITRPVDKVYEVTDDMEHATIGKDPKIRYVPGLVGYISTLVLQALPVEIFDLISYLIWPRAVGQ